MKQTLAATAIATVVSALSAVNISAGVPDGFETLFNGKDLSGWTVPEGDNGHWKVVDGVIDYDAQSEAKGDKNLWTKKEYGDFILKIDWRIKRTTGLYSMPIVLQDGKEETLEVKGVFVFGTGNKPITDFLQGAVDVHGSGCLGINKSDMSTKIPGVFGAGDVLCNDVKQAVVAAAEGCIAALSVDKYLHGRKAVKRDYN